MKSTILLNAVFGCTVLAATAAEVPRLLPFQARLTGVGGKPIPDGPTIIQFQLFSDLTSETPVWPGELHRVSVLGGLVNVLLGSKNPLPLNFPGDDTRPFFGTTLYLQATPDANGDGRITDDPPLQPRQAILPVLFAADSAISRTSLDSAKLAGRDWSTILAAGATDPAQGLLNGAKLAPGTVGSSQLAPSAVTQSAIANGAVGGQQIANGAVGAVQIAAGAVALPKLAARLIGTNAAGLGGIAFSQSSGQQSLTISPNSETPLPNLSASLVTSGRPVLVFLSPVAPTPPVSDFTSQSSFLSTSHASPNANVTINIYRSKVLISRTPLLLDTGSGAATVIQTPPSFIQLIDLPPAQTNTYSVTLSVSSVSSTIGIINVRLVAMEL